MIELLSYNTHLGKRIDEINNWARDLPNKPDVICYQELPESQVESSQASLPPSYRYEFAPGIIYNGETFGEQTLYDSSKVNLVSSRAVDLGLGFLERALKHSGQRSALLTAFEIERHEFMVANVHLSWFATHRRRREQLGAVIEAIEPQKPALIVGDFNYTSMIKGGGLVNFLEQEGFQPAGGRLITHRFFGIGQQVDYIFQRNCTILEVRVEDIDLSDHAPIFVRFEVN